jgi:hypothetical protein
MMLPCAAHRFGAYGHIVGGCIEGPARALVMILLPADEA